VAKKKDFDDPLADIDPIMEEAFSVSDEDLDSAKPTPKKGRARTPKEKKDASEFEEFTGDFSLEDLDSESMDEDLDDDFSDDIDYPSMEHEANPSEIYKEDLNTRPEVPEAIISNVQFPDIELSQGEEKINTGIFSNIPVDVSVELGRSHVSLKEVFELSEGSIIELERLVGEPLDLVVNGQVVAQGEVVAIDNNYGLRVTNVISAAKK